MLRKKITRILIATIMLLSMIPSVDPDSTAAVVSNQIQDYFEVDNTTGAIPADNNLAAGLTQQVYADGAVKVNKTIAPTIKENVFEITLEVVTTEVIRETLVEPDMAVVLLIDSSSSMSRNGYWDDALSAAKTFVTEFGNVAEGSTAERFVSVVDFNSNATTAVDWTNVANNYSGVVNKINDLKTSTGTNIETGMVTAAMKFASSAIDDIENRCILFLSDGEPSRCNASNCYGISSDRHHCHYNAEIAANNIPDNVTKYAVFLGSSTATIKCTSGNSGTSCSIKGNPTLMTTWFEKGENNRLNFDTVLTSSNSNQLAGIYEAILEEMEVAAKAWQVIDPLSSSVVFSEGFGGTGSSVPGGVVSNVNDNLQWNLLKEAPGDGVTEQTYTYTCTYEVELNTLADAYSASKSYATNDPTYLTYELIENEISSGLQRAYFNIPAVRGVAGSFSFTKVDSATNAGISGAEFTISHDAANCPCDVVKERNWSSTSTSDGTVSFSNIPSGHKYTLTETGTPEGYLDSNASYNLSVDYGVVTIDGVNDIENFTVYNVLEDSVLVTVTKEWNDNNDQDGMRPKNITVRLLADGIAVGEDVILSDYNNWSYSWSGLAKKANGKDIVYTVSEPDVPYGYTSESSGSMSEGFIITNSHTPARISVSGEKTWVDSSNQYNTRPESITVRLFANGREVANKVVTANDDWEWEFTDLPKYSNGNEIVYTVTEDDVAGYTSVPDGLNITNTLKTIDILGKKEWDDADNQDGIRLNSIVIKLLADGKEADVKTVTEYNDWAWTFENLPEFANGEKIVYTISEDPVTGYTPTVDGFNITNTHIPADVSVSGCKIWNDNDNQDGIRPESITVVLLADGKEADSKTVTAGTDNSWSYSFTGLPKYDDGKIIEYSIAERDVPDGYTSEVSGNAETGFTITNTHTPEVTKVTVSKVWDDADDQDGIRLDSITVNLLADGTVVGKDVILSDDNSWSYTWSGLAKKANGKDIVYTVSEPDVPDGYTFASSCSPEGGLVITNSHTPARISVSGKKIWEDSDDQDGIRPDNITVNLLANGQLVDSQVVTEDHGWRWTFSDLDEYADGVKIVYTIEEEETEGYTTTYDGYNITNSHEPETVTVSGSKTWIDNDNQDGKRPESITITLYADGVINGSMRVTAESGWTWKFNNLPKFNNGEEIVYTIDEIRIPEYTTTIDGYNVTNSHVPETIDISGSKLWSDNDDQDGMRPESITVRLLADGEEVAHKVVTKDEGWIWSFEDLPKYKGGELIEYTVTEDVVDGYTSAVSNSEVDGFVITNAHTPETTSVSVSKVWDDADDQDGIRPAGIMVKLYDGSDLIDAKIIDADDDWHWEFTNLPKYRDGELIVYTVTEDAIAGYTSEITGDTASGYTLTNSYTPKVTSVSGTKTWDDADNQDGKRPAEITVKLFADGTDTGKTATANAASDWKYTFENLPKYANGKLIVYTVTENAVEGYETEIVGFNITNTHTPEITEVTVTRTWDDGDNYVGKRPDSITVNLLADGTEVKEATITAENNWEYTFEDLPKYANGELIAYTVTEDAVEGYETETDGYNFTNSYKHGKLVIMKTLSGNAVNSDDEFTLKLTLGYDLNTVPADLSTSPTNDSIFAAAKEAAECVNIIFTRHNRNGNIVESLNRTFYVNLANEYEFKLKGGEKLIVSNLPDGDPIQYLVEETNSKGYTDTYTNETGKVSLYGDPVIVTVNNKLNRNGTVIPPTIPDKPPKTGDASVLGYGVMAIMTALSTMDIFRKK